MQAISAHMQVKKIAGAIGTELLGVDLSRGFDAALTGSAAVGSGTMFSNQYLVYESLMPSDLMRSSRVGKHRLSRNC